MDVKVHCKCGQRYRFEVEPENGKLPMPVYCPACGADGTKQANSFIQLASVFGTTGKTQRIELKKPGPETR